MPFYNIRVHGEGIRMPGPTGGSPIVGFYTSRVVWAKSEAAASERVLAAVGALWTTGTLAVSNTGQPPVLSVDAVDEVGFGAWLIAPNRGHTFYQEEQHAA
jgi:hypothetical protein